MLVHNYELLLFCLKIQICESHWEPQLQYLTFFKTGVPKNNNECGNSGIYGLSCTTYQLDYVGQTGRSLKPR